MNTSAGARASASGRGARGSRAARSLVVMVALMTLPSPLAGCLGGDDDGGENGGDGNNPPRTTPPGPPGSSTTPPRPTTPRPRLPPSFLVQGIDCIGATVTVQVDPAVVQPYLPEGFVPTDFANVTGLEQESGRGAAALSTLQCTGGGRAGGQSDGFIFHFLSVYVTAPPELADPNSPADLYLLAAVTDDDELGNGFIARNWTFEIGTLETQFAAPPIEDVAPTGSMAFTVSATSEALVTGAQGTGAAPPMSDGQPHYTRTWHAPAGRIEYYHEAVISIHAVRVGTGSVQATGGTIASEILAPVQPGTVEIAGPFNYLATQVLVRRAPA